MVQREWMQTGMQGKDIFPYWVFIVACMLSLVVVHGLLIMVASFAEDHRL